MNLSSLRKKVLLFSFLLFFILFTCNYYFDTINQPEIIDPTSSFEVEITVRLEAEDNGGIPYFGIRLPLGWKVVDNIPYSGILSGTLVYSEMLSDSMERVEKAPEGYYWWVSIGDTVDSLLDGNVSLKPKIQTDEQTGLFFIDYMLGDSGNGLNFRRNDHHPVSVGMPLSVTVTNTNDNGDGSLRQALSDISSSGEIKFDLSYPATILLDSQLVIDRNLTISGPESGVLTISGEKKHRVLLVKESINVNISNLTLSNGYLAGENFGGGIYCNESTLNLSNIIITDNSAHSGGGICSRNSDITLNNVTIRRNSAILDDGGGISCVDCDLICTNVLVVDNAAVDEGGGIECRGGTFLNLTNGTIANNTAYDGAGIFLGDSKGTIVNSILWDNSPESISLNSSHIKTIYSNVQGGFIGGEGNINLDPLFADIVHYYLEKNSPCIDSGDPDTLFNDLEDPQNPGYALWPALGGLRNDMGAYGGHGKYQTFVWNITSEVEISVIDFINEDIGWIAGPDILLKTENGGESWENIPIQWNFHRIDFINESIGWAIGNTSNVYRTEDGGRTWRNLKTFRGDYNFTSLSAVDDKVVFIVAIVTGTPYPCGAIVKTLDEGLSWINVTPDYDRWDLESVWSIDSDICIAAGRSSSWGGGILRTFDGGNSWDEKKVPEFDGIYDLEFVNNSAGYFLGDEHIFCQTRDTCGSWTKKIDGITSYSALDDKTVFAIIKDKFMKSIDGGKTWDGKYLGSEDYALIKFVDHSTGWIVNRSGTILKTTDGGDTWIDQSLAIILGMQENENQENQHPEEFTLSQNYPNPFNPSTRIKFALPKSEEVKIIVYNTLGQKVKILLNKYMKTGYHEVEFNAQNLSSGIYFYIITAGEFQDVKKMILIK